MNILLEMLLFWSKIFQMFQLFLRNGLFFILSMYMYMECNLFLFAFLQNFLLRIAYEQPLRSTNNDIL